MSCHTCIPYPPHQGSVFNHQALTSPYPPPEKKTVHAVTHVHSPSPPLNPAISSSKKYFPSNTCIPYIPPHPGRYFASSNIHPLHPRPLISLSHLPRRLFPSSTTYTPYPPPPHCHPHFFLFVSSLSQVLKLALKVFWSCTQFAVSCSQGGLSYSTIYTMLILNV